jgi:hypothetical protein
MSESYFEINTVKDEKTIIINLHPFAFSIDVFNHSEGPKAHLRSWPMFYAAIRLSRVPLSIYSSVEPYF